MAVSLAENIRRFRKERALTQEQLAEALGVTVGAVYKWEAGLSQPELGKLAELADYLDTSVDVLLGYERKDHRPQTIAARLKQLRNAKDRAGLAEAEQAMRRYPNSFEIVYNAAMLYTVFGVETGEREILCRALTALENARQLLPQNTDPTIGESTLCGDTAEVLLHLGREEEAVELLRRHNADGVYNDRIGLTLAADCNRPDEAVLFLANALLQYVAGLVRIVIGYVNVYEKRGDFKAAEAVLAWGIEGLSALKQGEAPSFLDKLNAVLSVCLAHEKQRSREDAAAEAALRRACELAVYYDAAPDYGVGGVRFAEGTENLGVVYDDLGTTAADSVRRTVEQTENPVLAAWLEEWMPHA